MAIGRILVIYKKSAYRIHVLERRDPRLRALLRAGHPFTRRMKKVEEEHRRTLDHVEKVLERDGLEYRFLFRTEFVTEKGYDLIVTVGGDGTLLLAAHHVRQTPVLPVHSSRASVGFLCGADRRTFRPLLRSVLEGRARPTKLYRLQARVGRKALGVPILNEAIFTNLNPAATSRYRIRVGRREEEQRSSGVVIGTAAGSTAAARSAGGQVLPIGSRKFQYVIRDLYHDERQRHFIERGILGQGAHVRLQSRMRHGKVYIDGPHLCWDVPFGETVVVTGGAPPLTVFGRLRQVGRG